MTREEYLGTFFVWSGRLQRVAGALTGFAPRDLSEGGRLRHLAMSLPGAAGEREERAEDQGRPEEAATWYRRSRAVYEAHVQRLTAAGARYPRGSADALTRDEGLQLIARRPLMHLALIVPLIWRGAALTLPLLALALLYSRRTRRADLAIFVLPALGVVMFYAMTTHFVERYGWVPRPVATIAFVVIVANLWQYGWPRRRAPAPASNPAKPIDVTHA
jgi:hypothetical protein